MLGWHRSAGITYSWEKPRETVDEDHATSHRLKWGPLPQNEVCMIAQHVSVGSHNTSGRKKKEKKERTGGKRSKITEIIHNASLSNDLNTCDCQPTYSFWNLMKVNDKLNHMKREKKWKEAWEMNDSQWKGIRKRENPVKTIKKMSTLPTTIFIWSM